MVDKEESVINDATAFTDNAFLVNELTRENLSNIGIQNCDTVIVGIGGKIDVSILTTLTVIQLGVPRVIALSDDISITEIRLPESVKGVTVQALNLRQRYGLNIIAVKHGDEVTTDITPAFQLYSHDVIAVVGRHDQVNCFEKFLRTYR